MNEITVFYVPVPDAAAGLALARAAVTADLAACGNVMGPMTSVYRWEGVLQEEAEHLLLLKTRADQADALSALLERLHPYECPCLLRLPEGTANPAYAAWVRDQLVPTA